MNKIFDDFPKVDCNECSRYWDSSCDGVNKDTKKPCNSFIATRSVIIPEQIKSLKKQIKWLYAYIILELTVGIVASVVKLLG